MTSNERAPTHNEGLFSVIEGILRGLALRGIQCALRGNVDSVSVPYVSDVDILIGGKHLDAIIEVVAASAQILRVKLSYGGLKLWVRTPDGFMKELDFIWRISNWGIIFLDTDDLMEILDTRTVMNGTIPVLSPEGVGRLIYAGRTRKEDLAKYASELRKAGITDMRMRSRALFLSRRACHAPLKTTAGVASFMLLRLSRLLYPAGVAVYCETPIRGDDDRILQYLFNRRIYRPESFMGRLFYRNIMGGLVFVDSKKDADVIIDDRNPDIAGQIVEYQRRGGEKPSRFQIWLA